MLVGVGTLKRPGQGQAWGTMGNPGTINLLRGKVTDGILEKRSTEKKKTEWACPRMRRMLWD